MQCGSDPAEATVFDIHFFMTSSCREQRTE